MRSGELGFWWSSLGGPPPPREPLPGGLDADVAIVGAGFTGLWTAYYLKLAEPSLQIAIIEAEHAGFGASGRNGGWVSGFFSGPARLYEHRPDGARGLALLQRRMFETVEEISRVVSRHEIDADLLQEGQLGVALDTVQLARMRAEIAAARAHGVLEEDLRELDATELGERVRIDGALGASFTPHVARVHPAKLVRGLAEVVEKMGVSIYERTPVVEIAPHLARTTRGDVSARWVVRATEGYTSSLRGLRRTLVPMNSSMIITEPLSAEAWSEIGWRRAELMSDCAHAYVYLQRSADGRIAIGGRGVPYRFGSRTDDRGETPASTVASLQAKLTQMFPATRSASIAHAWSGVLGVPRDWGVSVQADPRSGLAWAGGYVGEGVAASNLAARTLCELITAGEGELSRLPWVGRQPRDWEPEPLRWLSIRGVYALYRHADRVEERSGRASRLGAIVDSLSGRT